MSTDPRQPPDSFRRLRPAPSIDVSDKTLHDCLVRHGFEPADTFVQFKRSLPQQYRWLRGLALGFYLDTVYAARGDIEAKERVDYCRTNWEAMRRHRAERC